MCKDGYATGGEDGTFRLWSPTFEPVRTIPLRETPVGFVKQCACLVPVNPADLFGVAATKRCLSEQLSGKVQ